MRPQGVLETALYCPDLAAAEAFYSTVLGLEIGAVAGRHLFFRCGAGVLLLFNPESTAKEPIAVAGKPVPLHGAHGPGHMAFRTSLAEIPAWREHLQSHGVAIESEVAWPGGGYSLYFRDPADNSVEIATPELWGL